MTLAAARPLESAPFAYRTGPWQQLGAAPHKPGHAGVCRELFMRVARTLPVRVTLPDGSVTGSRDACHPMLWIHRDAFFHRVGSDGLIGFGESYMAGDWDAEDLGEALRPFAARVESLVPPWMQKLRRFYVRRQPTHDVNSRTGPRP